MGAITLLQGGESYLITHYCQEKLVKTSEELRKLSYVSYLESQV